MCVKVALGRFLYAANVNSRRRGDCSLARLHRSCGALKCYFRYRQLCLDGIVLSSKFCSKKHVREFRKSVCMNESFDLTEEEWQRRRSRDEDNAGSGFAGALARSDLRKAHMCAGALACTHGHHSESARRQTLMLTCWISKK